MKDCLYNKRGSIYVGVVFIFLIVLVLPVSLLNILLSNNMAINSNNDNYRAGYIIESILELKIEEIMELCDRTVNDYLVDLDTYNTEYIEIVDDNVLYSPPGFSSYVAGLAFNIKNLSEWGNNPFDEYKEKHYYKVDIECDLSKNCIDIVSMGEYRQARKFINVELELPTIESNGDDGYGLPQIIKIGRAHV